MSKKKKLARLNKDIAGKSLDILAILDILSDVEQCSYPTNFMIEIAKQKTKKLFKNIETIGKIFKITD